MSNDFTGLGIAHRRYGDLPFGIRQPDRLLHMYIIGQTGTGKSTLLANLALQDARAGRAFASSNRTVISRAMYQVALALIISTGILPIRLRRSGTTRSLVYLPHYNRSSLPDSSRR